MKHRWRALLVIGALAPMLLTSVPLRYFVNIAAYSVAILGVNLMAGFVGKVALGHGAFVGAGAYTAVVLSADHHWPLLATVPAAALVGFGLGVLIGIPALRIRGLHLALVTLAVGAGFGPVVKRMGSITNGTNGKSSTASWVAPTWLGTGRDADIRWWYLTVVVIAAVMLVLVRNLTTGRVGRALVAIRDGELAATSNGVHVRSYSVTMFGCSAAVAAIAGALLMLQDPFASPEKFESGLSLQLYAAATVGGLATLNGAVIGGAIVIALPYLSHALHLSIDDNVLFGIILIAAVTLFPGGLGSIFARRRVPDMPVAPVVPGAPGDGDGIARDAAATATRTTAARTR